MSFEINNVKLFSTWSNKDMYCKDCTICRQLLNNSSIYQKEKGMLENDLLTNSCGHTFHRECITPWLQNNKHCPNCSALWVIH